MGSTLEAKVVILVTSALLVAATAAQTSARPEDAVVLPFGPGEECVFSIGYGIVNAGEASITVEDVRDYYGNSVYHLRTRARSNRFFSAFFKVRDQADSYFDVDALYSHYYFDHKTPALFLAWRCASARTHQSV